MLEMEDLILKINSYWMRRYIIIIWILIIIFWFGKYPIFSQSSVLELMVYWVGQRRIWPICFPSLQEFWTVWYLLGLEQTHSRRRGMRWLIAGSPSYRGFTILSHVVVASPWKEHKEASGNQWTSLWPMLKAVTCARIIGITCF